MTFDIGELHSDPIFCERGSAILSSLPLRDVRSLDEMFANLQRFAVVRRLESRVSFLERGDRTGKRDWRRLERVPEAASAFATALQQLSEHARSLQPLITPALDEIIALAADEDHPLRRVLKGVGLSLGFNGYEVGWLFDELKSIGFRPVRHVCAGGFGDLLALLDGISYGEIGLLLAGFVRFTGDFDADQRIERVVLQLRSVGVTANVFLALVIVIAAYAVAAQLSLSTK